MSEFERVACMALIDAIHNKLLPEKGEETDEAIGVYETPESEESRTIRFVTINGLYRALVHQTHENIFDVKLGNYRFIYEI